MMETLDTILFWPVFALMLAAILMPMWWLLKFMVFWFFAAVVQRRP